MSFDPRISEWGNPPSTIRIVTSGLDVNPVLMLHYELSHEGIEPGIHRGSKLTEGTETSKYLEERKSTRLR